VFPFNAGCGKIARLCRRDPQKSTILWYDLRDP
jgi:hypothetical protein